MRQEEKGTPCSRFPAQGGHEAGTAAEIRKSHGFPATPNLKLSTWHGPPATLGMQEGGSGNCGRVFKAAGAAVHEGM